VVARFPIPELGVAELSDVKLEPTIRWSVEFVS
jgi:hypothetical protein